jgi:hypothetical protein
LRDILADLGPERGGFGAFLAGRKDPQVDQQRESVRRWDRSRRSPTFAHSASSAWVSLARLRNLNR